MAVKLNYLLRKNNRFHAVEALKKMIKSPKLLIKTQTDKNLRLLNLAWMIVPLAGYANGELGWVKLSFLQSSCLNAKKTMMEN